MLPLLIPFSGLIALTGQELIISQQKPHLLLVFTPTCPYCKQVLSYLKSIHRKIPLCNVRENKECIEKLRKEGKVAVVPCLFIDDRPLYDADAIIAWIKSNENLLEKDQ